MGKDKDKDQKVYAFIDSQNVNLAIRDQGWVLDFARFKQYLKDKYNVKKALLFIGYVPGNEMLYSDLQQAGFLIILKPTLEYKDRETGEVRTKGNVDAELVLYAMIEYPNYDKAIIVSGDGDFHCLIDYLQSKQKLSRVIIPNKRKYSALLRGFRKYFVYMGDLKQKLGKKTKHRH